MVYRQTELAIQWQKSSRAVMLPARADWFLQFKTKALCDSAAPCNVAAFHQANNPGKPLIPCVCNAFALSSSYSAREACRVNAALIDFNRRRKSRSASEFGCVQVQQVRAGLGSQLRLLLQLQLLQRADWRPVALGAQAGQGRQRARRRAALLVRMEHALHAALRMFQ